jgi:hypothetical protein
VTTCAGGKKQLVLVWLPQQGEFCPSDISEIADRNPQDAPFCDEIRQKIRTNERNEGYKRLIKGDAREMHGCKNQNSRLPDEKIRDWHQIRLPRPPYSSDIPRCDF